MADRSHKGDVPDHVPKCKMALIRSKCDAKSYALAREVNRVDVTEDCRHQVPAPDTFEAMKKLKEWRDQIATGNMTPDGLDHDMA